MGCIPSSSAETTSEQQESKLDSSVIESTSDANRARYQTQPKNKTTPHKNVLSNSVDDDDLYANNENTQSMESPTISQSNILANKTPTKPKKKNNHLRTDTYDEFHIGSHAKHPPDYEYNSVTHDDIDQNNIKAIEITPETTTDLETKVETDQKTSVDDQPSQLRYFHSMPARNQKQNMSDSENNKLIESPKAITYNTKEVISPLKRTIPPISISPHLKFSHSAIHPFNMRIKVTTPDTFGAKSIHGSLVHSVSDRSFVARLRAAKAGDSPFRPSDVLTLSGLHREALVNRRQSSLLVAKRKRHTLIPQRVDEIWRIFTRYILESKKEENELIEKLEEINENEENENEEKKDEQKKENSKKESNKEMDILDKIINDTKDTHLNIKITEDLLFSNVDDDTIDIDSQHLKIDPRLVLNASRSQSGSLNIQSNDTISDDTSSFIDEYEDTTNELYIDMKYKEMTITYDQFNIVLNNNNIETSPDMAMILYWTLLDSNSDIPLDIKQLGDIHTDSMKERSFTPKQCKIIFKSKLNMNNISSTMGIINNIVTNNDRSLHPRNLSYERRNYVIWTKIFEHLQHHTTFNVEKDYLYGALTEVELQNSEKVFNMLQSLECHWQHRVQTMDYIYDQFTQIDFKDYFEQVIGNRFMDLLKSWAVQLTDIRSGVARTAVSSLPTILSSCMICVSYPALIFDEELLLGIYDGIFSLVCSRRMKDLADDAYDCLIQCTDLFTELATDLKDYGLLEMVVRLLVEHSNKKEKHDRIRESCIGGMGFLLYGVEGVNVVEMPVVVGSSGLLVVDDDAVDSTPMGAFGDEQPFITQPEHVRNTKKSGTKLSAVMQREYLLENGEFMKMFVELIGSGVTDKTDKARRKTYKLLQRLERSKPTIWDDYEWDRNIIKRYERWKKTSQKTRTRTSSKNRKRKRSTKMRNKEKSS